MPLKIINTNRNTYPNPPNMITLSADSNNTSKARNNRSARGVAGGNEKPSDVDRSWMEDSPDVNNGDLLPACAVV